MNKLYYKYYQKLRYISPAEPNYFWQFEMRYPVLSIWFQSTNITDFGLRFVSHFCGKYDKFTLHFGQPKIWNDCQFMNYEWILIIIFEVFEDVLLKILEWLRFESRLKQCTVIQNNNCTYPNSTVFIIFLSFFVSCLTWNL